MGGRTLQHIAARCGSVNCSWNQIDRPACVEAAKTFGCKKLRKIIMYWHTQNDEGALPKSSIMRILSARLCPCRHIKHFNTSISRPGELAEDDECRRSPHLV